MKEIKNDKKKVEEKKTSSYKAKLVPIPLKGLNFHLGLVFEE